MSSWQLITSLFVSGSYEIRPGNKMAYLTIDDSPSADFLIKIEYLNRHEIPAIIFPKGEAIEDSPDKIQHAIRLGFVIGNHGYRHLRYSDLSLKQAREEILRADRLIEDAYLWAA